MTQTLIQVLSLWFAIFSYSTNSEELFQQAKEKIFNSERISYRFIGIYPTPSGQENMVEYPLIFNANNASLIGYDFVKNDGYQDYVYLDGTLRYVDDKKKKIEFYLTDNQEQLKQYIVEKIRYIAYSPIVLLSQSDWELVNDAVIDGKKLKNYVRVEDDEVINGNKVYTELHIFLDPESKLLVRSERKNYFNGNLSQTVVFKYEDYEMSKTGMQLSYDFPTDFPTVLFGRSEDIEMLKAGQQAKLFSTEDLNGKTFNLKEFKGKKILLNFSSVGCPHSDDALRFLNQNNITTSKSLEVVYLSIWDKREDVVAYFDKNKADFTVIPNADEIAETYSVSGTPTFFLINGNGVIEKVTLGKNEEFLKSLNGK